jgi:hypothetical protein
VDAEALADLAWRNAVRIFPAGTFDAVLGDVLPPREAA